MYFFFLLLNGFAFSLNKSNTITFFYLDKTTDTIMYLQKLTGLELLGGRKFRELLLILTNDTLLVTLEGMFTTLVFVVY